MKICLIFPRFKYPSGDVPLGLSYIAGLLRKEISGLDLKVIDTTFDQREKTEIINEITAEEYDIVGISCMTTMINDGIMIADEIRAKHGNTKIIFGGPHPTVLPEQTLENECVDAVIIGEGEYPFLELVKNGGDFQAVEGLWYKDDNGEVIRNARGEPIEDLDVLPFPAVDLFPMDDYFRHWFPLDTVARDLKGINIITSRGCPYQCTFCQPTLFKLFGKKVRKRSPRNIVDEIKYWQEKYGINAVMFQDDTFIFNKNWVIEICDLLIAEKVDIVFGCNIRANLIDSELFEKMKEAGLRKVNMGIESGNQRVLDEIYDKRITLEQVKEAVKALRSLDLKVQGYFMLGAPTETEKEINQTIKFAKGLDIDEATFSITTPLPGTHLYDKTKNGINRDINDLDYYKTSIYDEEISLGHTKLNRLKRKALLYFYLSPKRIKYTINSFSNISAIKKSFAKLKRF